MKVVEVSNKVYLVRHWLRWYRVQRGAAQWDRLEPIIKSGRLPRKPADPIDHAADMLRKKGSGSITPPIDLRE